MLQGDFLSVLEARNKDEFEAVVIRFAKTLGFDTVSATVVVDRMGAEPEFVAVHNTPQAYLQTFENVSVGQRDPVAQHCKRSTIPIIWSQQTYLEHGAIEQWEHQAYYGYRNGISMALHLPDGKHFLVGVDRDQALPTQSMELTRLVADLQLFAVHAQDTALRVLVSEASRPEMPALSPRELETLRWTMDGLSSKAIAQRLHIGERTVLYYITNAMQKLGCNSRHQAVLKALRLGLIH